MAWKPVSITGTHEKYNPAEVHSKFEKSADGTIDGFF